MKKSRLSAFVLSALLLVAAGCDDDPEDVPVDGGSMAFEGGADSINPVSDTNPGDTKAADASGDALIQRAKATFASVGGSTVTGAISFTQQGNKVLVSLAITGATPGLHGFHIHTNPSCADTPAVGDAGLVPAGGAGLHFNPTSMMHGTIESDGGMHHAGDFGNVMVAADGMGSKLINVQEWTVGDVVNRSVIIHAKADDLTTQPTGDSGGRQACGIIAPF